MSLLTLNCPSGYLTVVAFAALTAQPKRRIMEKVYRGYFKGAKRVGRFYYLPDPRKVPNERN